MLKNHICASTSYCKRKQVSLPVRKRTKSSVGIQMRSTTITRSILENFITSKLPLLNEYIWIKLRHNDDY